MKLKTAMRILNNQFDHEVRKSIRHTERVRPGFRVTCRPGCHHCCHFLITCSVAEAANIYDYLGREKIEAMVPRLIEDSKWFADPSSSLDEYTEKWKPCTLLSEDGKCGVYPVRPMVCRAHHSFSDPKNCEIKGGRMWLLEAAMPLCGYFTEHFLRKNKMPSATAPLQYQLLLMLHLERQEDQDAEANRLRFTSAFDHMKSLKAWIHLADEKPTDEMIRQLPKYAPVYPVWEHFE